MHSTTIKIKNIASGSKGNCTLLICNDIKLLIDIGITYKQLNESLENNGLNINDFLGVLITHNHKDHIKGLKTLLNKTDIKVLIPKKMFKSIKEEEPSINENNCIFIDDNFNIGNLNIELLNTSHDAPVSVGYNINYNDKTLVYITDTGYLNRKILTKIMNKNIYFIESNHDEAMLMDGPYPRFLKERVISDYGHLSNKTTANYLKKVIEKDTKYIVLAHLSEINNTKDKALDAVKDIKVKVLIADQKEGTPFIEV